MEKIISFEDFTNKASELTEENDMTTHEGHGGEEKQYYMFFQNLASIKHYVDEILTMDPAKIDSMLQNGHDWAADHITTSKDDIQEVAEWIRNEIESQSETQEEPIQTVVDVEDNDDNVEVEVEDEEDEDEDE